MEREEHPITTETDHAPDEQGCVWTRAETPDDGAGRELADMYDDPLEDEDWQAYCSRLADTYWDMLREQAPCATWHYWSGTITACVRHIDRIDPRAAWATAQARMAESTPEAQS